MKKVDRPFIVYCHTNNLNGKKYIGITSQNSNQRFKNGNGYKSNKHFFMSIQKYGWNNFTHEILFKNLSQAEAQEKEIYLISKYNTRNSLYGYNIAPGGEVACGELNPWFGKHHTEDSKKKMSEARKGIPKTEVHKQKISMSNKGKKFSDESRKKMSLNHADVSGKHNPNFGKKLSDEHIQKMVEASKSQEAIAKMKKNKTWYSGKDNPNSKRVLCIETGVIYETLNDAARENNCNPTKVSAVCHGHRKHTQNLHFKFMEE